MFDQLFPWIDFQKPEIFETHWTGCNRRNPKGLKFQTSKKTNFSRVNTFAIDFFHGLIFKKAFLKHTEPALSQEIQKV